MRSLKQTHEIIQNAKRAFFLPFFIHSKNPKKKQQKATHLLVSDVN